MSHEHDDFAWMDASNYKQYEANPEVYEIVEELLVTDQLVRNAYYALAGQQQNIILFVYNSGHDYGIIP